MSVFTITSESIVCYSMFFSLNVLLRNHHYQLTKLSTGMTHIFLMVFRKGHLNPYHFSFVSNMAAMNHYIYT